MIIPLLLRQATVAQQRQHARSSMYPPLRDSTLDRHQFQWDMTEGCGQRFCDLQMISRLPCGSLSCPSLKNDDVKKSHRLILLFGFWKYFVHCLGIGVEAQVNSTSRAADAPLLERSPALIEVGQY